MVFVRKGKAVGAERCHAVLGIATQDGPLNYDELVVYDTAAIFPWLKVTYTFTKLADASLEEEGELEPEPMPDSELKRAARTIVTASGDKTVRVWSAATGECVQTLAGHSGAVTSAQFSPEG